MTLHGHLWTLGRYLTSLKEPDVSGQLERWRHERVDARGHSVTLSGALRHANTSELLVVLHGLGGSVSSRYMPRAFRAASLAGVACLLLNARGSGDSAAGVAHAGLSEDLAAAVASPELARYQNLYILGYSMGGHVALHYACREPDPRVRGIVAACSPLDLEASMRAFDRPTFSLYRKNVLGGLTQSYARWAQTGRVPAPLARVRKIRKILEWDQLVVAPAFGFADAWDYYRKASVAQLLGALRVPVLYVGARRDPMVPFHTVATALEVPRSHLQVHWSATGGHLALPEDLSLGFESALGFETQGLAWLRQHMS